MKDIAFGDVNRYLNRLAAHDDPLLREMEAQAERDDFPIVGPAGGRFLYLLTRISGARRVFELGSGFGYSTLWFARAVAENGGGEVHHTVWDEALSQQARRWLQRAGLPPSVAIHYHVMEALTALKAQTERFDIIFVDITKQAYPGAVRLAKSHLRQGGLLLLDNMFWSGRVLTDDDQSEATEGIRAATRMLRDDPAWDFSLAPIRDGIAVARLREE